MLETKGSLIDSKQVGGIRFKNSDPIVKRASTGADSSKASVSKANTLETNAFS
jgi:hypothetical protein